MSAPPDLCYSPILPKHFSVPRSCYSLYQSRRGTLSLFLAPAFGEVELVGRHAVRGRLLSPVLSGTHRPACHLHPCGPGGPGGPSPHASVTETLLLHRTSKYPTWRSPRRRAARWPSQPLHSSVRALYRASVARALYTNHLPLLQRARVPSHLRTLPSPDELRRCIPQPATSKKHADSPRHTP